MDYPTTLTRSFPRLAKYIEVSPSYLYRIFQEYTRPTPMDYMERIRIKEASRLLQSITEIAIDRVYLQPIFCHGIPAAHRKNTHPVALTEQIDYTSPGINIFHNTATSFNGISVYFAQPLPVVANDSFRKAILS
jgi:AraC-like DNA-binding protein